MPHLGAATLLTVLRSTAMEVAVHLYITVASVAKVAAELRRDGDGGGVGSVGNGTGMAVIGIKSSSKHIGQDSPGVVGGVACRRPGYRESDFAKAAPSTPSARRPATDTHRERTRARAYMCTRILCVLCILPSVYPIHRSYLSSARTARFTDIGSTKDRFRRARAPGNSSTESCDFCAQNYRATC